MGRLDPRVLWPTGGDQSGYPCLSGEKEDPVHPGRLNGKGQGD